jgi:DNA-binding CsgD family transcriptional regulator
VAELALSRQERAGLADLAVVRAAPVLRATLWEQNPDLTALLRTICTLAGIALEVAATTEVLLATAIPAQRGDILFVDCSWALAGDAARCGAVATQAAIRVYVIHPRGDALSATPTGRNREAVTWLQPEQVGLGLVEKLRLLQAMAPATPVQPAPLPPITVRQQEVLQLIGAGLPYREIARRLCMGESTVKAHVAHVKEKWDVSTREGLMAAYRRLTDG